MKFLTILLSLLVIVSTSFLFTSCAKDNDIKSKKVSKRVEVMTNIQTQLESMGFSFDSVPQTLPDNLSPQQLNQSKDLLEQFYRDAFVILTEVNRGHANVANKEAYPTMIKAAKTYLQLIQQKGSNSGSTPSS